jgi:predicted porin
MKKSSALALAIAGTMAAPVAMAESGFYASLRIGVEMEGSDNSADEQTTIGNKSSRLGWRNETDLGNGMTAYGRLEVTTAFGERNLYAGLKGDFGDVRIAEQGYAAYYNHVSGPVDQPYWATVKGIGDGNSRSNNFITYIGGTDAFSFEVTAEANGSDTTDPDGNTGLSGIQAGASIGLGDWTLGLGMRDAEDSDDRATNGAVVGATLSGSLGDIGLAVSMNQDDDDSGAQIWAGFGAFWVEYGQFDDDSADATPSSIAVGWSKSIGRNTTIWAEYGTVDEDGTAADNDVLIATLRYDWK